MASVEKIPIALPPEMGVPVEDVLDRLERKYQAMTDGAGAVK